VVGISEELRTGPCPRRLPFDCKRRAFWLRWHNLHSCGTAPDSHRTSPGRPHRRTKVLAAKCATVVLSIAAQRGPSQELRRSKLILPSDCLEACFRCGQLKNGILVSGAYPTPNIRLGRAPFWALLRVFASSKMQKVALYTRSFSGGPDQFLLYYKMTQSATRTASSFVMLKQIHLKAKRLQF